MEEHILVGLSSAPSNARIIRTAATMAKAFGCKFTALFVRTPDHDSMPEEDKERLRANTSLAKEFGATVETVLGDDVSYQLAEYARLSGITKIVVGRSAATRKHLWSKPALTEKLASIAPNLEIHIIPDVAVDGSYRPQKAKGRVDIKTLARDWLVTAGILILATLLCWGFFEAGLTEVNIVAVYLLAVLLTSMATSTRSSYLLSAFCSVLVFNFFFTTPRFSLNVYEHGAPLTFLIMTVTALVVGTLTDRLKSQAAQSAKAAYRTNLLFETSHMLQKAASEEKIFQTLQTQAVKLLDRQARIVPGPIADEPACGLQYPVKIYDRIYGVLILEGDQPPEAFENSLLLSILGECALALESSRNAAEKEEAKLQAESEKLRANLLRSISHDLRTPLTAISGNASILLSDSEQLSRDTREQIYGDIYDDAAWLHNLVENLLAVTKIEEGRMALKTQLQLAEEIVSEALRHISRKKSRYVITVQHENELLFARCDARLIVQTIINLVDNAIKYTPEGSHISITTKQQGQQAVFAVSDDGPGIPDAEKKNIFQMFYTGANAVADSRRSLGLGLCLCKSIISAHGGTISVSDNRPRGTVFTFTVPSGAVDVRE